MDKIRQDINIGKNIKEMRTSHQFTQEQVTAKMQILGCEITRSTYSRYETGELNIRVSDLVALRNIFNCRMDDFFNGIGVVQPHYDD